MIVDVHYHFIHRLPTDRDLRGIAELFSELADRWAGIRKSLDEVMSIYRDYGDDVECDKLVKRMEESGIDITVINLIDNIDEGLDNEQIMRINECCSKAAAKHPGRIIALAGTDPRRADAPALFRKCIEEFDRSIHSVLPDKSQNCMVIIRCFNCGHLNEEGWKFCKSCGSPLRNLPEVDD